MEGNEYLPILISLLNSPTGEIGKINDSLFWTGTIPSSKVDEKLVSNDVQRKKLKELIEGLEEYLKSLREVNNGDFDVIGSWMNKKNPIIQMLQSGPVDLKVYVKYLIEHYRKIKSEEEKEFKLILPENKKKMEAIINIMEKGLEREKQEEEWGEGWLSNVEPTPWDAPLYDEPVGLVPGLPRLGLKSHEIIVLDKVKENKENRKKLEDFLELVDKYVEDDGKDKQNEDTENGIDVFTEFCRFIDINEFGLFGNNVSLIMLRHCRMIFLLEYGDTFEKLSGLDGPTIIQHFDENLNDETMKIYYTAIAKTLMKYIDYISIGKFILIVMQKYIWQYNNAIQSSEMDVNTFLRTTLDMQSCIKSLIDSDIIGDSDVVQIPNLSEVQNTGVVSVSKKSLKTYLGRNKINVPEPSKDAVNAELYLTPEVYNKMISLLFTRKANLKDFGNGFVSRMKEENLQEKSLQILALLDFSNLQVLYNTEKIDKSFLNRLVSTMSDGKYKRVEEKTKNDPDSIFYQFEFPIEFPIEIPSVRTLVAFLIKNQMIDYANIYTYFLMGYLDFFDLEEIENNLKSKENITEVEEDGKQIDLAENFVNQIKEEIKESDLIGAYQSCIQRKLIYEEAKANDEPNSNILKSAYEEARAKKNQILLLYKKYKLATLGEDVKNALLNDMLEQFCVEFLDAIDDQEYANNVIMEMFREMYKDALIGFDNINSVDSKYLQELILDRMFVSGELSLEDIRRLRNSLQDEALVELLNGCLPDDKIPFSKKVNLIRNIFYRDRYDDEIAKLFLAQINGTTYNGVKYNDVLDILKKNKNKNGENEESKTSEINDETNSGQNSENKSDSKNAELSKPKIYPQYIRRLLFYALDPNIILRECKNGYTIAFSPKLNSVIVEKTAQLRKGHLGYDQEPYGYSTRILKMEDFYANQDKLIETLWNGEEILNEEVLLKIVPRKDRVAHNTQSKSKNWLRAMAEYFGIDLEIDLELVNDSRYTKEELAEIRSVITEYEHQWIELEDR